MESSKESKQKPAVLEPEMRELIMRSRPVVLELLESRGYDTTPFKDQAPSAVGALALPQGNSSSGLRIKVKRRSDDSAPKEYCDVVYFLYDKAKPQIQKKELTGERRWEYIEAPETTEYIFILTEQWHELFNITAVNAYHNKIRLSFFHIKQLVMNPTKHMLVPKHDRVPPSELAALKKELNVLSLSKLPLIKYHIDIQARWLGLVPGDVVKITRPSPTSGEYTVYRYCTL